MTSSILKEIAELSNPNPRDFDPEALAPDYEQVDSDNERDPSSGREHYVEVG
jgi:hypothetical protein